MYDKDERNEIEEERLYENGKAEFSLNLKPIDVDIITKPLTIYNIVERLKNNEIIMDPVFQRKDNLWDEVTQSQLIESLIIRIPLPSFYFAIQHDDAYVVVDGVQRLTAIKRFMALEPGHPDKLRLQGLEYLPELDGLTYEGLPLTIRRRINEESVTSYLIRSTTPSKVVNSIFRRINTGGMVLTPAEIKNAIYQEASPFVRRLADSVPFKEATRYSISTKRMLDREFVNRFLAFHMLGTEKYKGNLEVFLCEVLEYIETIGIESEECISAEDRFLFAMKLAYRLFEGNAFRKFRSDGRYSVLNKPLFDSVSVNLARLTDEEGAALLDRKDVLMTRYHDLLMDEKFIDIISMGTATIENVKRRHEVIGNLIKDVLS